MKIFLARHGQTNWNAESRVQGRTNVPLNETGRTQAKKLHEKIKDLEFNAVYASPLQRAVETAKIATNSKYKIIYDDRLLERSFGDHEGRVIASWSELIDGVDIDDVRLKEIPGNVEPVQSVLARASDFIEFLKQNYHDDAKVLVVGHGALSKAFHWILSEHGQDESFGNMGHLGNAEVQIFEI